MSVVAPSTEEGFRHEALFYAGEDGFLEGTVPFIRDGVRNGEPVLVVVGARKIQRLRGALGPDADGVLFADMAEVGCNPARIIPAWQQFVDGRPAAGAAVRGIGEPIFPERSPAELAECHRHESLLNLAFADTPGFWLLCPYDTSALEPAVIEHAQHTHPYVAEGPRRWESERYPGFAAASAPFGEPLPEPEAPVFQMPFGESELGVVRRAVAAHAEEVGMEPRRTDDLSVAVSEVATNSVRYGGGEGLLRVWLDGDVLVCEVTDRGGVLDPLAGRVRPSLHRRSGFGLWIANQICDLVQIRVLPGAGIVRLHMRLA